MNYWALPGLPFDNESKAEDIIIKVCAYFKIDRKDLLSKKRYRQIVYPRQICTYFLRKKTTMSLAEIGRLLGNRDHTTSLHSIRTIEALLFSEPSTKNDLISLRIL